MFIHTANEMSDKHHMIRPYWLPLQGYMSFTGRAIALPVVAIDARAHEVFPRVKATTGSRRNVVHGECDIGFAAILAPMAIATQDILTRKDDFLVWNTDVDREADDAWKRHRYGDGMERSSFTSGDQFSFAKIQENNCFLHIANT
ncbi:MAG: hypothetical protein HW374_243 [Bacteroidetes bacterium]|nr:hypothetical protein [Bacteroidota bacterium]